MQVADPVTLYNRPENTFVAGFIGMPEMNLIDGKLLKNGSLSILLAGQTLSFGEELGKRLVAPDGSLVTVGIRPQHFSIAAKADTNALAGRVSHIEFMGHEVYLHVDLGEVRVVVVVPSDRYNPADISDSHVKLKPREAEVHVFDRETGKNVSLPANV